MNNYTLYIDDFEIPTEDIISFPKSKEQMYENNKILPAELSITLDNVDKSNYDDRDQGSFFYGTDWYNSILKLYDNDKNKYTFEGTLYNLIADDKSGKLEIEASNFLTNLKEKTCVYSNTSNKTSGQIIYELLTDEDNGNIDSSYIVYSGFQNAINIQGANSAYFNATFTADNNKNILDVINELCRITQCHLYTSFNLIYMYQWQPYDGEIAREINKRFVVEKSFKQYYDNKNIYNSCNIAYDSGGSVAYSTDTDTSSIAKFGERIFKVPNEDVESTTTTDFNIICKNATGAAWLCDLAIQRFSNHKKKFEIKITDYLSDLEIGNQIDLNFDLFVREPGQIIEKEYDSDKGIINIVGEFLNTPTSYYSRDTEPPDAPELISVLPFADGTVILKWTKSTEADFLGYKIYCTSTPGMWYQEESNFGRSPIDSKTTQLSDDGFIYQEISQLNVGTQYYFKITSYDSSFNESDFSNIKSCTPWSLDEYYNAYNVNGDYVVGIELDEDNSLGGVPPAAWDVFNYTFPITLQPAGIYESGLNYNKNGMTLISFKGYGDDGAITFQYKYGDSVLEMSEWSTETNAIGNNQVNFEGYKYILWRFIFNSTNWNDGDKFIIKELY